MTATKDYNGLLIGTAFTIVSLLLTITFIVPIVSILPGLFFEALAKALVANEPYSRVGRVTILLLTLTFLLTLTLFLIDIRDRIMKHGSISKRRIVVVLGVCYFIVHSLGFCIYWGLELDFRNDGQLIFGAASSFPASSVAFIFIGLLIDIVKNTGANTSLVK